MKVKFFLFIILFFFFSGFVDAEPVSIEGANKIRSSKGYTFTINYQTKEEWTDGIIFRIYCRFDRGENIVFSSGGLSNIKKGWHKVTVNILKVYRERYGPIVDYRIELYHRGVLAALRGI